MLKTTISLVLSLFAFSAFAGTATSYRNDALEFVLVVPAMSDTVSICDSRHVCFDFEPVKEVNGTTYYTETIGRCELEVEYFSKDFAKGKTKHEYMLNLSAVVVQVVKGDERCQLQQRLPNQNRSLTGVYGL